MIVDVRNLKVEYHTSEKTSYALKGASFSMHDGEILGIVGESGSGKTTLGLALAGLLPSNSVYTGEILFEGRNLVTLSFEEWRTLKGDEISVVFQEPMSSLNPLMKVGKQVGEVFTLHEKDKDKKGVVPKLSKQEKKARVIKMFEEVELEDPEEVYGKYPHELSGGMQQRVMIAMALLCEPKLLIADEPTTALDTDVQDQILDLLKRINKNRGTGIIFVSHDLRIVREICDRALVMYKGEIVEADTVENIFERPAHEYTKSLVDALNNDKKTKGSIDLEPALEVKDLSVFYTLRLKQYGSRPVRKYIFENMNFIVKKGEILGLVGKSGCGKSSVSKTILGLHKEYAGEYVWHADNPQMIFQNSSASLNPARKIGWILEEPLKNMGKPDGTKYTAKERKQKVLEMLEKVEIPKDYAGRYPSQLSGGQKQRINIALTLISGSKFIIADEPVSALDVSIQEQILKLLLNLQKEFGLSMLFISHDKAVVDRVCDRVINLEDWANKRIVTGGWKDL